MATRSTYLKIGLLVLIGGAAFLAVGVLIGLHRIHRTFVPLYTYFDEAVTGLDVGSPVRARGVPIGQVGSITFAPDHRRVEVRSDIDVDAMERLGLPAPQKSHADIPSNLRAQLATQGFTGLRYIALDFFDEKTNPPPVLSFAPHENYVPAARSVQKTLEETATDAANGIETLVETFRKGQLSERIVQTTTEAHEVLALLHQMLEQLDQEKVPERAGVTVDQIRQAATRLNQLLDHVDGEKGLIATTQRSVGAVGEAGRQASDATRNLGETLEEIRSAAASIRALADRLERDPDMLLKGRGKDNKP